MLDDNSRENYGGDLNGSEKDYRPCPGHRRDSGPDCLGGWGRHRAWGLAWLRVQASGGDGRRGDRGDRRCDPNAARVVDHSVFG